LKLIALLHTAQVVDERSNFSFSLFHDKCSKFFPMGDLVLSSRRATNIAESPSRKFVAAKQP